MFKFLGHPELEEEDVNKKKISVREHGKRGVGAIPYPLKMLFFTVSKFAVIYTYI